MTFALETFWPATDGWSAARIEEQLVVTADGCEVITKFPAEELLVCGVRYYTGTGPLADDAGGAVAPEPRGMRLPLGADNAILLWATLLWQRSRIS